MKNINSFNSEDIIEINGQKFKYFDLNKAAEYFAIDLSKVPISIKIIIENLLRNEDGENINNDKSIRCLIITGAGDKAFVAGADISEFADFSVSEAAKLSREGQELLFDFAENLRTPIIAAINGFALGGGLELAMLGH